jgi:glycosyltransferase involved in cell wall biosynthesis
VSDIEMSTDRLNRRALFIVITDYPGGAERVTSSLANELASRPGWQVELMIVCSRLPDSFSANNVSPQVRIRYGPFRRWYPSFLLLPLRLLFRRYDLVFATHVYVNALVSTLRDLGLLRIQRLVTRESTSVFDRFRGIKRRVFALLYRRYGAEDLLIAQSSYMEAHVAPRLPARSRAHLRTLPNPVSLEAIEVARAATLDQATSNTLAGEANILFCGRLIEVKRPALALESFRLLSAALPTATLIFMGSGPLETDVREQARRAGLSERVRFLGQRADPYSVMAACHYGLLTSAHEGFPNVVLEMMACGIRKIVVTPCAGDLDALTGVAVTRTHDATEIASTLQSAVESGEDCRDSYAAVVRARSAGRFIDEMLPFPAV